MEYLAFYRKYRPKKFDEVVGQQYIIKTLKNVIKTNNISHSYIFVGPRGTGKTSVAKIFAKTINCKNPIDGVSCETCENCKLTNNNENIDIIEMDAASNNGVDEIREIKNHVSLMPNNSKYKIYIIDEVHMLSTGAFNALLKTLEEPPKHVIFILATTDFQKVPLTIKSRCQIFEFKPIFKQNIIERLKEISEKENIKIESQALTLIADTAKGGLRDAISLFDQLSTYTNKNIKYNDVIELSGRISQKETEELLKLIINQNYECFFQKIDDLENKSKNFSFICEDLIIYLKNILLKTNKNLYNLTENNILKIILTLNECINNMKTTNDKRLCFDIYMFKVFELNDNKKEQIEEKNTSKIEKSCDKKIESKEIVEKKDTKKYKIFDELMNIRINNVLLNADKKSFNYYNDIFNNLKNDINNLDELKIINLLLDCNIRAGSSDSVLITVNNQNLLYELYNLLFDLEKIINTKTNKNIKICFINENIWQEKRPKFIEKKKNNQLNYIDETDIIQNIVNLNKLTKNEFEDLLEIGE